MLSDDEVAAFDVVTMPDDSPVGYFIECDLHYPPHLHDLHNAYPLAPEHVKIEESMLSDTLRFMLNETNTKHTSSTKLVTNLHDKTHYVMHYCCLQFYLTHGLELIKVHRVIAFNQSRYMLPFIKLCNDGRKNAQSDFEASLYKLIANAFYGKTVDNVPKRSNIRLIADSTKFVRAISKATYKRSAVMNDQLALVENMHAKIKMCKPIAVGCTILEIAKFIMYQFYYDCLLPTFGERLRLCFTDTDSFICHIQSEDLIGKLDNIAVQWLDTSNFELDHPLYSNANFRALWKFKSDTASVPPLEFCGLHSKMYSLSTLGSTKDYHKAKGVPKTFVKQNVKHEQYLDVLRYWTKTSCIYLAFRSRNHRVVTRRHEKVCLSCIDDKHHLLPDCVHTLAYGHYSIADV